MEKRRDTNIDHLKQIDCDLDFVSGVLSPRIYREPENKKITTFDFVAVDFCLTTKFSREELRRKVSEHIGEIIKYAYRQIGCYHRFKKYPELLNYIRPSTMTITSDRLLHIVFELKGDSK